MEELVVFVIITFSPLPKICLPGSSVGKGKAVRKGCFLVVGSVYSPTPGAGAWVSGGLAASCVGESLSRSLTWLPACPSGRLGLCPGMRAPREKWRRPACLQLT